MRRSIFFHILFSLCLLSSSAADEVSRDVVEMNVVTNPDDAEVFLETSGRRRFEEYLGKADTTLLLDLTRFEGASGFNLIIRREGYFDKSERVPLGYFDTRDQYPEFGSVRLEPHNLLVPAVLFLQRNILGVAIVFSLSIAGIWFWRRRRKSIAVSAAVSNNADPRIGSSIPGYLLEELVGVGGSAHVYRASSTDRGDEVVAVKVFRPENLSSDDFMERFRREADVCRKLVHKGIVPLLDWGTLEDQTPYLVMEYVQGTTLAQHCAGIQAPRLVLDYLRQAADALGYAHEHGVVHRDVKPDNFLVNEFGKLKLMDFGLARQVLSSFTKTGQALGTPAFMSPEQIRGAFLDHRSDQYSLGALGYQLLAGRRPFIDLETEAAPVLFKQVNSDPTPLEQFAPNVPAEVVNLISKLMARDPEQRFPNMKEVVNQIDHLLQTSLPLGD